MGTSRSGLFEDYAAYHRHPVNKLFHFIGIPIIVFTVVGLLFHVSWMIAAAVAVLVLVYDARLSPRLTVPFAAFLVVSFFLAPWVPLPLLGAGFVAGWVLQFAGHFVYEKKSPAFFKNLRQLLVGPLWIIEELRPTPSTPREAPGSAPLGD